MPFCPDDRHIVVTYHHVEDPHSGRTGIHSCSCADFERQVEFLSHQYRPTSIPEVYKAARANSTERLCAVTFDDGLKNQYSNAIPTLKKYKTPATFFIITGTLVGEIPTTHKIHALLSLFSGKELVDRSNLFLARQYSHLRQYHIPTDVRLTKKRAIFDTTEVSNFKETMTILPEKIKDNLLNHLCDSKRNTIKNMVRGFFMGKKDVQDLYASGFWIGSHTHNHEALDVLEKQEVQKTVHLSKEYLERLIKVRPTLFCYPHGSSTKDVRDVLRREGFEYAVTVEQRAITSKTSPFLIPRYDTNDIGGFLDPKK